MGLFDKFKKSTQRNRPKTDNRIDGPVYLDGLAVHIPGAKGVKENEWRGKLQLPSGQTRFSIRYYGQLQSNLITATEFAPALIIAVDNSTGQEIVLFDGCRHGYNALFCDSYTDGQIKNRLTDKVYIDKKGNEIFEVIIGAFYSIDYDEEEFIDEVNEEGFIELFNGDKILFEIAKRNGFDRFQIRVINDQGKVLEIVSEELAG